MGNSKLFRFYLLSLKLLVRYMSSKERWHNQLSSCKFSEGISLGSLRNVWVHLFILENMNMFLEISRGGRRGCVIPDQETAGQCSKCHPHRFEGKTVTHARAQAQENHHKEVVLELLRERRVGVCQ